MFSDNERVWKHVKAYVKDRVIAYGYCASPDKMVFHRYRPGSVKGGVKGRPYLNLSRREFDDVYFDMFDWDEQTGGLPAEKVTGIYASLSRYSCTEPPVIKNDFHDEMLPYLESRDFGFDFDMGLENVTRLDEISLGKYHRVVQLVWDSLKENGLKPTCKYSGSGFHVVAPVKVPRTMRGIEETVHTVSRYVVELGLSEIKHEYRQNKFIIPGGKHPLNVEVHRDLNRVFTIPFSPYVKRHKTRGTVFEDRTLLCIPLKDPSDMLEFTPERATTEHVDDIITLGYPGPAGLRESLINEAFEHYEKLEEKRQKKYPAGYAGRNRQYVDVSIDNLPPRYRHLKQGVKQGCRDNSVTRLVGVFKTCGLSRAETEREVLKFNRRCSPPLSKEIVLEKVERLYRKSRGGGSHDVN